VLANPGVDHQKLRFRVIQLEEIVGQPRAHLSYTFLQFGHGLSRRQRWKSKVELGVVSIEVVLDAMFPYDVTQGQGVDRE